MYAGTHNFDVTLNGGVDFPSPAVPGLLVVGTTDNDGRIKSGQDLVPSY